MARYWIVKPVPGYLPSELNSTKTVAEAVLPPPAKAFYNGTVRKWKAYYMCFLGLTVTVGLVSFYFILLDRRDGTTEWRASIAGWICITCFALYGSALLLEFHIEILKRLFVQFEGWFFLGQCVAPIALFGYLDGTEGRYGRAAGMAMGLGMMAGVPLVGDCIPHLAAFKLALIFGIEGLLLTSASMLWMAGLLYVKDIEGIEETEITLFDVPIHPWLIAADSLVVITLLHLKQLRRTVRLLQKPRGHGPVRTLRFANIKWPMAAEDCGETLEIPAGGGSGLREEGANDIREMSPLDLRRSSSGPRSLTPHQMQEEQDNGSQARPTFGKERRALRMLSYRCFPVRRPVVVDGYDDTLALLRAAFLKEYQRVRRVIASLRRTGGKAGPSVVPELAMEPTTSSLTAPGPLGFFTVGREHHLCLAASLGVAVQAGVEAFQGPFIVVIISFILTVSANLMLLLRAHPMLVSMLVRSFDFIVMFLSLLEFFVFAGQLLRWDSRCLTVAALALTTLTSMVMQDTIVMAMECRKRWLWIHFSILLLLEVACGLSLVFLNHHGGHQVAAVSTSSGTSIISRSPVSLALDGLTTIVIYSARSLLGSIKWPDRMVSLLSDVDFQLHLHPTSPSSLSGTRG